MTQNIVEALRKKQSQPAFRLFSGPFSVAQDIVHVLRDTAPPGWVAFHLIEQLPSELTAPRGHTELQAADYAELMRILKSKGKKKAYRANQIQRYTAKENYLKTEQFQPFYSRAYLRELTEDYPSITEYYIMWWVDPQQIERDTPDDRRTLRQKAIDIAVSVSKDIPVDTAKLANALPNYSAKSLARDVRKAQRSGVPGPLRTQKNEKTRIIEESIKRGDSLTQTAKKLDKKGFVARERDIYRTKNRLKQKGELRPKTQKQLAFQLFDEGFGYDEILTRAKRLGLDIPRPSLRRLKQQWLKTKT